MLGLSPPTRGSHSESAPSSCTHGSIPAHTGKPWATRCGRSPTRVYPRPHGEAQGLAQSGRPALGLSPPTRGSRTGVRVRRKVPGSIPAHTGKPFGPVPAAFVHAVYPRPHGEAGPPSQLAARAQGLSPPTRGSRNGRGAYGRCSGSIPAHTGKPPTTATSGTRRGVYPRPHGEAQYEAPGPQAV